jgi:hypothetical protein
MPRDGPAVSPESTDQAARLGDLRKEQQFVDALLGRADEHGRIDVETLARLLDLRCKAALTASASSVLRAITPT